MDDTTKPPSLQAGAPCRYGSARAAAAGKSGVAGGDGPGDSWAPGWGVLAELRRGVAAAVGLGLVAGESDRAPVASLDSAANRDSEVEAARGQYNVQLMTAEL